MARTRRNTKADQDPTAREDERTPVFVSYQRNDEPFAIALTAHLQTRGLEVWRDGDDIAPAAAWRDEIEFGLREAAAVIVVVTPDSMRSTEVGKEIARADELGKLIVPVLHRDAERSEMPKTIQDRNWIFWRGDDDAPTALSDIDKSLTGDPDWVKEHTQLNRDALRWDEKRTDRSRMLSGAKLESAEAALAVSRKPEQPQPTDLMREFVAKSRAASRRRQRRIVTISLGVAAVSITLAIVAVLARFEADRQRDEAVRQRDAALSGALAAQSANRIETEPDLSALLALEAYRTSPTIEALGGLLQVNDTATTFISRNAAHETRVDVIAVSDTRRIAASADLNGEVVLWDIAGPDSGRGAIRRPTSITVPTSVTAMGFDQAGDNLTIAYDDGESLGGVEVWQIPPDPTTAPERTAEFDSEFGLRSISPEMGVGASLVEFDDGSVGLGIIELESGTDIDGAAFDLDSDFGDGETIESNPVFSADGTSVAIGIGGDVHVWRWTESTTIEVLDVDDLGIANVERLSTSVTSTTFLGNGDRLAFGIDDGEMYIVDISDLGGSTPLAAVPVVPAPTSEALHLASLTVSNDGTAEEYLVSAHNNGKVEVWFVGGVDAFGATTLRGHDEEVHAAQLTADGLIVSGSYDGDIIWSDFFSRSQISRDFAGPDGETSHAGDVHVVDFIGDDFVVSLGDDGALKFWDPASGALVETAEADGITSLASTDSLIAVGDGAGGIAVIEPASGENRELEPSHDAAVIALSISDDGSQLVSVDADRSVWLWDIDDESRIAVETSADFQAFAIAFPTADSLWLGGALSEDGAERSIAFRIDTTSGQVVESVLHNDEFGHTVTAIALSPDGSILATGGTDRRIFLFDTSDTSAAPAELAQHLEQVTDIEFLDDGVMLSSDRDATILMWDVDARRPVGELSGPGDGVLSIDLNPSRTALVGGGEDNSVWVWDLEIERWIEGACRLAGRNLTVSEWERFQLAGEPIDHCSIGRDSTRPAAVYPAQADTSGPDGDDGDLPDDG